MTDVKRCIVCKALLDSSYFTCNGYVRLSWRLHRRPPRDDEGWVCDDDLDLLAQILHVTIAG